MSASIAIVDDDEVYRTRLGRAFERRGFRTFVASDGEEALAVARAHVLDFASVDLRMPGTSGLDVVKELHAIQPRTAIVVLTGYGSIATALEAVRLGAIHYLAKPADASDLLAAFARASQDSPPPIPVAVPSLARAEWEHINRVLADCGGNISQAARVLRIQRRSLQRKLAKHPVPR